MPFWKRWLRIRFYRYLYRRYMDGIRYRREWSSLVTHMNRLWEDMSDTERLFIQRTEKV